MSLHTVHCFPNYILKIITMAKNKNEAVLISFNCRLALRQKETSTDFTSKVGKHFVLKRDCLSFFLKFSSQTYTETFCMLPYLEEWKHTKLLVVQFQIEMDN